MVDNEADVETVESKVLRDSIVTVALTFLGESSIWPAKDEEGNLGEVEDFCVDDDELSTKPIGIGVTELLLLRKKLRRASSDNADDVEILDGDAKGSVRVVFSSEVFVAGDLAVNTFEFVDFEVIEESDAGVEDVNKNDVGVVMKLPSPTRDGLLETSMLDGLDTVLSLEIEVFDKADDADNVDELPV